MKKLFYFLGIILAAIVLLVFANMGLQQLDNPGYVLIGVGHWSLETSLIVFTVGLVISFLLFYLFFRFLGWLFRQPKQRKLRDKNIKFNRSQEALIAGLVDSAEGNWEKAENILIKHASHSGAPLIHYLTAARAAQSRGAYDKRDEYLRAAHEQAPDSNIVIGLTQAELNLSGNQFEQALETLSHLHSIDPTHASVLKLLHQTYQHIGDWQGLRKIIPYLNTQKILMETEVKLLEIDTFSQLLKQTAANGNTHEIQALWWEIPDHLKSMPGIAAIYFAAMINAGAGADIEQDLADSLSNNWDVTLLSLYGTIQSPNVQRQLENAEKWVYIHQENAVLLTVLGRLAIKSGDSLKAESYLAKSIAAEPTVQAYQLLGDLLFAQGDKDNAFTCYKSGLELASNEIISRIDSIT